MSLLVVSVFIVSCGGDYRKLAQGEFGHATVIMDSTQWDSQTANAIRSTYGGSIETLPQPEPRLSLEFRDFKSNEELEQLKKRKNIIIATPINSNSNVADFVRALLSDSLEQNVRDGQSFAFPFEDRWYRDQYSVILTSTSDSALARKIRNAEERLAESILDKELRRWEYEVYERGRRVELEQDSLWDKYGWKIGIQHDWFINVDTSWTDDDHRNHFLTMRRNLPDNRRWFWIWWKEGVADISYLDKDWINAKRDSLMKVFIRGTREESYLTTEYRRQVESESFEYRGDLAYETLGTWRMTNDAMGGPFVNLTVYDDETNRLFIMEFGQFAPRYHKRRFVRQFRAMIRTFQSDSTWNKSNPMATN